MSEILKLSVTIQPNAKKTEIVGFVNNVLKIKIQAAPIDGKANQALIDFLALTFKTPKKNIKILRGATSKNKIVQIMTPQTIPLILQNEI